MLVRRFPSLVPKSCLLVLFVALFSLSLAHPQKSAVAPPKYEVQGEAKMKGTVEELKLPPKGSEKEAAHLLLKVGADTVDVYLCPPSYLDDMGVTFKKGDEISLTGSKIKQDGADLIVAREVVKGTDALMLRDEKGVPVWNWRH
jgi:hypothetical protein